jgi:hypothetical protein
MEGSSEQIVKANPPLSQVCCTAIPSMICRLQTAPLIYLPVRHTLQTYGVSDRDLRGAGIQTPLLPVTHTLLTYGVSYTHGVSHRVGSCNITLPRSKPLPRRAGRQSSERTQTQAWVASWKHL